jgi:hypothetical protein
MLLFSLTSMLAAQSLLACIGIMSTKQTNQKIRIKKQGIFIRKGGCNGSN